jgi:CRISPR system Cascade subunit CasA
MWSSLDCPIFSVSPNSTRTLPGLLAGMARDEVRGFPAQRPHQRAAWHMFLVQLAALALWTAGRDDLPETEDDWRALLLVLTGGDTRPWALTGPEDKPAFLQPPAPKGLKWTPVETPDALDLLITSRNHDLKQQIARHAEPQDWVFALVSLQTSEGYGGAGNNGIARMNGGSSSRPLMGIAPATWGGGGPDPSSWWARDVGRLLALRATGDAIAPGTPGGASLLWCLDWTEGRQLDLTRLDPWFIEVCRRVRLETTTAGLTARRTTSKAARIDAKVFKGATGDPWAPITTEDPPKGLTLGEGDFTYRRLCDLMFSNDWLLPALAEPGPGEADCLIVAEALSRGNSKTDGWKSRVIPVPGSQRGMFRSATAGTFAQAQINEIKVFDEALRNALALIAARGEYDGIGKAQYAHTTDARARFDRAADALFFPALWDRLAASTADGKTGEEAAHERFISGLRDAAKRELATALPAIPCAAIYRPRAEARAKRAFTARLRKAGYLPSTVPAEVKEPADV